MAMRAYRKNAGRHVETSAGGERGKADGADEMSEREGEALTSIDISISGTQRYQSICLSPSPSTGPLALHSSTFPLFSLCTAAETIIEIGTFRPCMFRIPGVLPAETVID